MVYYCQVVFHLLLALNAFPIGIKSVRKLYVAAPAGPRMPTATSAKPARLVIPQIQKLPHITFMTFFDMPTTSGTRSR